MRDAAHTTSIRSTTEVRLYRIPTPRSVGNDQPTYLLLHGVGLSHRSFTPLAKVLSTTGETIALDLPGFGATATPRRAMSVKQGAVSIANVIDRMNVGPVIVVGHSMGTQFALELSITRPDLVDAVVMVGPVIDPRWNNLAAQGALLIADMTTESMPTNVMAAREYLRCGPLWFMKETLKMLAYPTHERIHLLRCPLLVVRGEHDTIANEKWADWLSGQVDQSASRTIQGHSHNVVYSGPAEVAAAIVQFRATCRTRPTERPVSA